MEAYVRIGNMMISKKISLWISQGCGIIGLFLGILFGASLIFSKISLIQLAPTFVPIKFNTALCFTFSGLGLLSMINNYNKLANLCGIFIFFVSGLTLLQYSLGISLGIDQFFIKSNMQQPILYPGRMAPISASAFFLCALIFMSVMNSQLKWFVCFSRFLAVCIFIMGVISLSGYLIGAELDYHFGWFSAMSPQAAVLFIILGIGLSANLWHGVFIQNRNIFAIFSSFLLFLVVLFFSVVMAMVSMKKDKESLLLHLEEEALIVKHRIADEMNYSILSLRRMAQRWEMRGGTPESEWRADVQNYIRDTGAIKIVMWADKSNQITWAEPQDIDNLRNYIDFAETNKSLLGKERSSVMLSSPVSFMNKYLAIMAFIPLYVNDEYRGYIVGVYNSGLLVTDSISSHLSKLYNISLSEGNKLIYGSELTFKTNKKVSVVFPVFNKRWTLTISPKEDFFEQHQSILPYLELLTGVLFSLLIGSSLYYALTAMQRNRLLLEQSEALAESQRRQQQLVDDVHDYAIFWLDLDGKIETWNIGAERIYGYKSNEIIKKHFSILFSKEANQKGLPHRILHKAIIFGKYEGETEFTCKNVDKFWTNLVIEVLKNSEGIIIGFVVIVRDITQQHNLEQERSKLIAIIDESPDYIGMSDIAGNLLFHNRSAKRMLGLDERADVSMMTAANVFPSWAFDIVYNQGRPAASKHGCWNGETAVLNQKTGQETPVLQTLILHRDSLGKPICFTAIMRDITERKKAEEALKNSEELFRSSMEHAAIGMALVSIEGRWLMVNKALCDMLGYTEKEMLGMDFQTITHPDDLAQDMDIVHQLIEKEAEKYYIEKRYFRKDGTIIWISLNVSLAWQANGQPNYFIVQIQNISDRKQAEAVKEQLMAQLTSSNMELERFAYVASHDMQEPLRMVVCFSDILVRDFSAQLSQEAKEYLNIVSDSGRRMQDMIQDLLEYSRISSETRVFKSVNGEMALENALGNIKIPIEESQAQITSDKLPNFSGNPVQIMRLLQNLIMNAIKYHIKGVAPLIHIGVESRDKEWCIFVQDNGLGIPEEFVEQIFQPFRRLQTWHTVKGTGLGLAICKKIVENHGGKIWVEPAPSHGSIFYFTLPKTN